MNDNHAPAPASTPTPTPAAGPVWVPAPDSDAIGVAVTAAAHAVLADADRQGYTLTYEQCEELAITVISHYQTFISGIYYGSTQSRTTADPSQ